MFGYPDLFERLPLSTNQFERGDSQNSIVLAGYNTIRLVELPLPNNSPFRECAFCLHGLIHSYTRPVSNLAKQSLFYIESTALMESKENYYTRRDNLDSYLLKYTISGNGYLEYEGNAYEIPPKSGFFIDCKKEHYYRTQGQDWGHVEFHLNGSVIDRLFELFHADGTVLFHVTDERRFLKLLDELIRTDSAIDPYREFKVSALINNLLIQLISHTTSYQETMNHVPNQLNPLVSYIEENYAHSLTLDTLSEYCGLSKYHMCRVFRKYTGFSVGEYISRLRIDQAKKLLESTSMTAAQVGYCVGIVDENYFYRLFKKQTGVSPKKFALKHIRE